MGRSELDERCTLFHFRYLLKKPVAEGLLKQRGAEHGAIDTPPETNKKDK
jgi:hypothetical protein